MVLGSSPVAVTYTALEWNKLDWNMQIPKLNRLRFGLSHLNQHKFNHNFKDCVNPLCPCSLEIECPLDFFLHCHYFTDIRKTFFNEKLSVDENTFNQSDNEIVELLL